MTERPSLLRLHRAQVCQIPREQAVKLCRLLLASQRTWRLNKTTAKGQGLPSESPGGPYAALPSMGLWVRGLAPFASLLSRGARNWSPSHRKSRPAPQGTPQPGVQGCAKQPASPTDGRAELPSITTVSGQLSQCPRQMAPLLPPPTPIHPPFLPGSRVELDTEPANPVCRVWGKGELRTTWRCICHQRASS